VAKECKYRDTDEPYKMKQLESFAYVNTKPDEWKACQITGMNQVTGEVVCFDPPSSYKIVIDLSRRDFQRISSPNLKLF
jgi:hypothetical protein